MIDVKKYLHFGFGLKDFLGTTISLEDAYAITKKKIEERELSFLSVVRQFIYGDPKSPYKTLLDSIDCSYQDIETLIRKDGLEKSLLILAEKGIYVTLDEFKGRKDIIRNGICIPSEEVRFDNHCKSGSIVTSTGGTMGRGTRTDLDFNYLTEETTDELIFNDIFDLIGKPKIVYFPILPFTPGIKNILILTKLGNPPVKWYSQLRKEQVAYSLKYDLLLKYISFTARRLGYAVPYPEVAEHAQVSIVAEFLRHMMENNPTYACVKGYVSSLVGICKYAVENNIDISNITFIPFSEPLTKPKKDEMLRAGNVRVLPVYATTEAGRIAYSCGDPLFSDDMHLLKHKIATVVFQKELPNTSVANTLLLTTLSSSTPKILLNVDLGDIGYIESRTCSCPYNDLGLTDHISHVVSTDKQFSSVLNCEIDPVLPILEEQLPKRFGGSCLDYQLVEDMKSGTLCLMVNPRVNITRENGLRRYFIQELHSLFGNERSIDLGVTIGYPVRSRGGKIFSFFRVT